ncbi:MAG: hypothetical protein HDR12_13960 [Lachnospiraceae bacterium]|nr:hypothetical protein [Lachnospiraceae bacterium]
MEVMENAKITLSEMLEAAGKDGITDGQALVAITSQGIDYYAALKSLPDICQEIGAERTTAPNGITFLHHKPKEKKKPEESAAVRLARKLGKQTTGEIEREKILNYYR